MKRHLKILALTVGGVLLTICLIFSVYLAALFVAHGFNRDFLAIDSCLDFGGRWNYATRACEHE